MTLPSAVPPLSSAPSSRPGLAGPHADARLTELLSPMLMLTALDERPLGVSGLAAALGLQRARVFVDVALLQACGLVLRATDRTGTLRPHELSRHPAAPAASLARRVLDRVNRDRTSLGVAAALGLARADVEDVLRRTTTAGLTSCTVLGCLALFERLPERRREPST